MTKNNKIARLKKLSAEQLDEFCIYWNSGPVHDGSRQKAKESKVYKDQDYQKGFYREYPLSDGWAVYLHRHDDLLILSENETVRLKGSAKQIVGLLYNLVLAERKREDPIVEMVEGTILFHVYPTLWAKRVIDTIRITEGSTEDWINNGEQSATEQLGPFLKNGELVLPQITDDLTGRKIEMDRFDYENFDYEAAFRQVQEEVSKPNILICGVTGIGKSTMI